MAVIALTVAVVAAVIITYNSGVLSRSGGGTAAVQEGQAAGQADQPEGAGGENSTGPAPSGKTYVVQDGDSFYSIARKFNTSISEIQKLNPNVDPQNLTSGTRLNVP